MFTKAVANDGTVSKFIDLSPDTESVIAPSRLALTKVKLDPKTMLIDLTDTTFSNPAASNA